MPLLNRQVGRGSEILDISVDLRNTMKITFLIDFLGRCS